MFVSLPGFAVRYIPEALFFGGLPEEEAPEAEVFSGLTRVTPKGNKKIMTVSNRNKAAKSMWTEKVAIVDGKREGPATWKNTKTGVEVQAIYKEDLVQSVAYTGRCCDCDCDTVYTSIYVRGGLTGTQQNCTCASEDTPEACCCGECGSCLCRTAESSWDRSYGYRNYW